MTKYNYDTWQIAKRDLNWQGGTIHQLASECGCNADLLLADAKTKIEVLIGSNWHDATFISLDGMPLDKAGKRWAKFSAFVPGFNNTGSLSGLRGDYNIRLAG